MQRDHQPESLERDHQVSAMAMVHILENPLSRILMFLKQVRQCPQMFIEFPRVGCPYEKVPLRPVGRHPA